MTTTRALAANRFQPIDPQPDALPMPGADGRLHSSEQLRRNGPLVLKFLPRQLLWQPRNERCCRLWGG